MPARLLAFIGFFLLVAWMTRPAEAHPHAWVDIQVTVAFNADGDAIGLTETWLFDAFYTAYATSGFDGDGDGAADADRLDELLAVNLEALAAFDYFTKVETGGRPVPLEPAVDAASVIDNHRLRMTFRIPFATPVPVAETPLRYAVFDPTYFVELLHADAADAIRLAGVPDACSYRLIQPDPAPEMIALALTLDQTQSADDGLGQHFAEWVTIRCR